MNMKKTLKNKGGFEMKNKKLFNECLKECHCYYEVNDRKQINNSMLGRMILAHLDYIGWYSCMECMGNIYYNLDFYM